MINPECDHSQGFVRLAQLLVITRGQRPRKLYHQAGQYFCHPAREPKILDFGLAKLLSKDAVMPLPLTNACVSGALPDETRTVPGVVMGTVAYMSPEQVRGDELDARTDLFSLGAVLFEMATGQQPFAGETTAARQNAVLNTIPALPSSLNPTVHKGLDHVICKALEKNPRKRYQSAAEPRDNLILLKQDSVAAGVRSRFRPRAWIFVAALTMLFSMLSVVYSYLDRKKSRQLTERDIIVLADFSNTTGDSVFDETLKQALRAQLEQSPFLNVLSDQKVIQELGYMGHPHTIRLAGEVARELCVRTGSKALISGTISNLGAHYALALEAMNCRSGDSVATEQSEAESREGVLRALGEAASRLRARLGESLASIQKYDAPVEQATTKSIQALRAYSLGVKTKISAGDEAAIPFFQRAIDLDPDFAMAYIRMGTAYSNLNQRWRTLRTLA